VKVEAQESPAIEAYWGTSIERGFLVTKRFAFFDGLKPVRNELAFIQVIRPFTITQSIVKGLSVIFVFTAKLFLVVDLHGGGGGNRTPKIAQL